MPPDAPRPNAPPPLPPGARALVADTSLSIVRYRIAHLLHRVEGRSSGVQARAVVHPDGRVEAAAVVPVQSFRSGDADRDARAFEILGRFAAFKGEARVPPGEARAEVDLSGDLALHGVKQPLALRILVEQSPDGGARVRGRFDVSLDAHRVERPSLLFVKIEDTCHIDFDLALREEPRA
jgi:polyisoprenoid-binding protein YceI